jgi:hypothetical protein
MGVHGLREAQLVHGGEAWVGPRLVGLHEDARDGAARDGLGVHRVHEVWDGVVQVAGETGREGVFLAVHGLQEQGQGDDAIGLRGMTRIVLYSAWVM